MELGQQLPGSFSVTFFFTKFFLQIFILEIFEFWIIFGAQSSGFLRIFCNSKSSDRNFWGRRTSRTKKIFRKEKKEKIFLPACSWSGIRSSLRRHRWRLRSNRNLWGESFWLRFAWRCDALTRKILRFWIRIFHWLGLLFNWLFNDCFFCCETNANAFR